MTDDDPNEAYEVVPIEPGPHGPPQSESSRRKGVGEGEGEMRECWPG
jgi:hypothetical protein